MSLLYHGTAIGGERERERERESEVREGKEERENYTHEEHMRANTPDVITLPQDDVGSEREGCGMRERVNQLRSTPVIHVRNTPVVIALRRDHCCI